MLVLLAITATLASLIPARRALRLDPSKRSASINPWAGFWSSVTFTALPKLFDDRRPFNPFLSPSRKSQSQSQNIFPVLATFSLQLTFLWFARFRSKPVSPVQGRPGKLYLQAKSPTRFFRGGLGRLRPHVSQTE